MKTGITVYGIFFVINLFLIAFAADNTFLVLLSAFVIIGLVLIFAVLNERFQMAFFIVVNKIVDNNNNIFYAVALTTVLLFVGGLYFGGGEPIFATSTRIIRNEVRAIYSDDLQKAVNEKMMRGKNLTNDQVVVVKAILAASNKCSPKMTKDAKEEWDVYVEKLNNHLDFKCFATDVEMEKILAESTVSANNATKEKEKISSPSFLSKWLEDTGLSWFWWKAFIVFLFVLCPISFVISFHDEVANGLEGLVRKAKEMKESSFGKTAIKSEDVEKVVKKEGGLFMKILSMDLISEMIQVLIKALRG